MGRETSGKPRESWQGSGEPGELARVGIVARELEKLGLSRETSGKSREEPGELARVGRVSGVMRTGHNSRGRAGSGRKRRGRAEED